MTFDAKMIKMSNSEEIRKERERLKQKYSGAFSRLSQVLFTEDPIGINFGDNTDEYEPEVGTILSRLSHCRSTDEIQKVVHEEFVKWFDSEIAGPFERYETVAKRIYDEVLPTLSG